MIKSVIARNYLGEEVKITLNEEQPEHGLLLTSITGLGPAKANVNITDLVTSDGGRYNSARLDNRNIVIKFRFTGFIEDARNLTYKYFPIKHDVTLTIETDRKTLQCSGYVESNEPYIFSDKEGNTISILCPDPYFYDVGDNSIKRTIFEGIEHLFYFPFESNRDIKYEYEVITDENDDPIKDSIGNSLTTLKSQEVLDETFIEFGEIHANPIGIVHYAGTIEIGFIIKLHFFGPVDTVTIYNLTTRDMMSFNGPFKSGDDVIIDSRRGKKSITLYRQGVNINLWTNFSDYPSWFVLQNGDNIFSYTYTSETGFENIEFMIEYQDVYEGI